jgi:ADP-glucose pyrophosphorylase
LSKYEGKTSVEDSIIADGSIITESSISRSIVGLRSRIDSGSEIEDSIIMGTIITTETFREARDRQELPLAQSYSRQECSYGRQCAYIE